MEIAINVCAHKLINLFVFQLLNRFPFAMGSDFLGNGCRSKLIDLETTIKHNILPSAFFLSLYEIAGTRLIVGSRSIVKYVLATRRIAANQPGRNLIEKPCYD